VLVVCWRGKDQVDHNDHKIKGTKGGNMPLWTAQCVGLTSNECSIEAEFLLSRREDFLELSLMVTSIFGSL
jgi:hypothetical protein